MTTNLHPLLFLIAWAMAFQMWHIGQKFGGLVIWITTTIYMIFWIFE